MKIAISSTGNSPDSKLDQRFGRCTAFAIYDTVTENIEMITNPHKDGREGVGPAAVQLVAGHGVKKIISGEFGFKIKSLLDSLGIQMIILKEPEMRIKEVIEMLKKIDKIV